MVGMRGEGGVEVEVPLVGSERRCSRLPEFSQWLRLPCTGNVPLLIASSVLVLRHLGQGLLAQAWLYWRARANGEGEMGGERNDRDGEVIDFGSEKGMREKRRKERRELGKGDEKKMKGRRGERRASRWWCSWKKSACRITSRGAKTLVSWLRSFFSSPRLATISFVFVWSVLTPESSTGVTNLAPAIDVKIGSLLGGVLATFMMSCTSFLA